MAEIHAIVCVAIAAIKLGDTCRHNTRKSNSLIRCLQAVKAPLESIDRAEHDRIQVSHEETLGLLKDVIERAHALLEKQTKAQNYVLKTLRSSNVRDQFHEIQIDLQAHLQTLTLSVGVLSGVQIQKMQVGLDVVKEVNREALEEHLIELRKNQGAMQDNQRDILENQNTTHDNQRNMLNKADMALRNQDEMLNVLSNLHEKIEIFGNSENSGNSASVVNNYVTHDNSTTTNITNDNSTNITQNILNNCYGDISDNSSDKRADDKALQPQKPKPKLQKPKQKPQKPEPYVKRKTKLHVAAIKGSLSEVEMALREVFIDHETSNGSTALLLAVENNHTELVKELLLVGVDFTVEANQKAWMKVFETEQSDSLEHEHLIPHFTDGGADINLFTNRYPCLLTAVVNNYVKVIKELLLVGVDFAVEANQKAWIKMIDISCASQRVDLIPHFVSGGVNINATLDRKYAQLIPRFFGPEDPNYCYDGLNLLHLCIRHKCLHVASALIKAGADVNARRGDGGTPLTMSSTYGLPDITLMLINTPGCLFIPDKWGNSALHYASKGGNAECVTLLIRAGADKNAKNIDGKTPEMLAGYYAYEVREAFETALMTSSEIKEREEEREEQNQKQQEKQAEQEKADDREACCYLACCPIVAPLLLIAAPGYAIHSIVEECGEEKKGDCLHFLGTVVSFTLTLPFAVFKTFGQCFGCINER